MIMLKLPDAGKRWESACERWRRPGELFQPREFGIDLVPERAARAFVERHHYSRSFPAARLSVGLYRKRGVSCSELVGVAVFSVPMQNRCIPHYTGLTPEEGVELGRFVLREEVAYNGESWFLSRAFRALRQERQVHAVLSYADPLERRTEEGVLTKPAHQGQIYRAVNAHFAGRSGARYLWIAPDGCTVPDRALSKIRRQEQGHAYAERLLLSYGCDPRRPGEAPDQWVSRVVTAPIFRRLRHPGNYVYLFGLDEAGSTAIRKKASSLPYAEVKATARTMRDGGAETTDPKVRGLAGRLVQSLC